MKLQATNIQHICFGGLLVLGFTGPGHAQPANPRAPLDDRELHRAILVAEDRRAAESVDLDLLSASLGHRSSGIQQVAVRALGRLERPDLLPVIAGALGAASPAVRSEAANAIAQSVWSRDTSAEDVGRAARLLLAHLDSEANPSVEGVLLASLGRLPFTSESDTALADTRLRSLLAHVDLRSEEVRLGAVRGLEALSRLRRENSPLSSDTTSILREIVQRRAPSNPGTPLARRLALTALINARAADRASLDQAIGDPDVQVRRLAALGAALVEPPEGRRSIIDHGLRDPSPSVRYEALKAYGRLFVSADCGPLRKATTDESRHVGLLALDLLGEPCADPQASRAILERAIEKRDWHRTAHAYVALARRFPDAAKPLEERFASDRVWQVRMYAARAAGALKDGPRLERLAADDHDNVREAAVDELRRVRGHDADEVYIGALARSDYQLLITAAAALEGSPRRLDAVPALLAALARITREHRDTSRDARLALLTRLGELATAEQAAALEPYLADFDREIAKHAARVVSSLTGRARTPSPTTNQAPEVPGAAELEECEGLRAIVSMGGGERFELALVSAEAPITVTRFVRLARSGYYNGLTFHRVVPNFVIQGGSPGANEYMGDANFLRDEVGIRSHSRGTLGISTRGRDTGDAQIFINLVDNPRLDHTYTVFAEVVRGMDVVDRILEGGVIERIEIAGRPTVSRAPSGGRPDAKRALGRD